MTTRDEIQALMDSTTGGTSGFRNTAAIRAQATRIIRGPMPADVRNELRTSVKAGLLGHLKRDGLKPEIFFHPDHRQGAIDIQKREAEYSVRCIASVMASPEDVRDGIERNGGDVFAQALADFGIREVAQ